MIALSSVVGASAMAASYAAMPDLVWLAIILGVIAGMAAGMVIGAVNGAGVALLGVSPFMMTLGMASVGFGIALYMTGGTPVYGMPVEFGDTFGFGSILGLPAPVVVAAIAISLACILVNRTRLGRYFYAVGGNIKAARLSGINTQKCCSLLICFALPLLPWREYSLPPVLIPGRPILGLPCRLNPLQPVSLPVSACGVVLGGLRMSCWARFLSAWCKTG